MSAELITKLVAAGLAPDLVAEVAMALAEATAGQKALEQRREADRERKQRERERSASRDVTGRPVTSAEPADSAPAAPLDKKTPPDPLKELNPPAPTVEADASTVPPAGVEPAGSRSKVRRKGNRRPGSRLGADWQPPAVAELPLEVQAIVGRWPAGAYEVTALQFRNHWFAEGRAIGAKRDWPRTWCNWVIREATAVKRAERAGVDFAEAARAAAPGTGGEVNAQRLAETAAAFRRIGRIEDAEEYERLAEAAGHRALDSS